MFRISAFDFARVGTASGPSSWRRKEAAKIVAEVTENVRSSCKHSKHHHAHYQHQNIRSLQSSFQHTAAPTSQNELKHFGNLKSDVPKCFPSAISTRRAKSNQLNFPSNFPNTFLCAFPRSRLEGLPPLSGCSRNQPRLVKSKQNNNHFLLRCHRQNPHLFSSCESNISIVNFASISLLLSQSPSHHID